MKLASKNMAFIAQMFHTFHTYSGRYGRLEANSCAVVPYLPHVPYRFHTHIHMHTHTRTRAHAYVYPSFLVWKVWKVWKRLNLCAFQVPYLLTEVWKGMEV